MTKRFSLDGTQLKFLALLFMLIDHIHYFFEFTGAIPEVFFIIGRLSAYLFLFCMIEGFLLRQWDSYTTGCLITVSSYAVMDSIPSTAFFSTSSFCVLFGKE